MSPLITVDDLRALAAAPVLVDVTWNLAGPPGKEAYDAGHLPGAYFVDLDTELAGRSRSAAATHCPPQPL